MRLNPKILSSCPARRGSSMTPYSFCTEGVMPRRIHTWKSSFCRRVVLSHVSSPWTWPPRRGCRLLPPEPSGSDCQTSSCIALPPPVGRQGVKVLRGDVAVELPVGLPGDVVEVHVDWHRLPLARDHLPDLEGVIEEGPRLEPAGEDQAVVGEPGVRLPRLVQLGGALRELRRLERLFPGFRGAPHLLRAPALRVPPVVLEHARDPSRTAGGA